MAYWRSTSGFEVDFILGGTAVEVKAGKTVSEREMRGLRALREEKAFKNYILVCFENSPRTVDGIRVVPWKLFLEELWSGEYA